MVHVDTESLYIVPQMPTTFSVCKEGITHSMLVLAFLTDFLYPKANEVCIVLYCIVLYCIIKGNPFSKAGINGGPNNYVSGCTPFSVQDNMFF